MDDRRMVEDEALRGSHLGGQSSAHGMLLLQGEGRGMLAVPGGSHNSLDHGDSRNQCRGSRRRSGRGSNDVGPCRSSKGREARRGTTTLLSSGGRIGEGP
jgi:hypothetical protein